LKTKTKTQNDFNNLLQNLDDKEIQFIDKLQLLVEFIRPQNVSEIKSSIKRINKLIDFFHQKDAIATNISQQINTLFLESKISSNITTLGILSRNGLSYELKERFYNKFLPNPPKKGDLRYIFATLFNKQDDSIWVKAINNKEWIEFFKALFSNPTYSQKTKNHLFNELLYAIEILSIWIASEEFDENFIRLDKSLLNSDSAFIALQRDFSDFIYKIQANHIDIDSTKLDFKHLDILIQQCYTQIQTLEKNSLNHGISIDITYKLERLSQIVQRLENILKLIKHFDTQESYVALIDFFKESVIKNETKNSLIELYELSSHIIAKSITKNASEHGEHYITSNFKEYIKMFLSASGAGIIIAIMALIKINIVQAGFEQGVQTVFASLNYGIGFVLIHMLGFTVATKQPAMTASTFAQEVEKEENNKANQKKLISLIFQVSRSQFAAVMGNVTLALLVAFGIAYWAMSYENSLLSQEETLYYLNGLEPFAALFFAAIAGVWLFCSGLIAGYFDNRADLLELKQRYYHQPLLKKLLHENKREKLANYLHEHHGAIAGNFFFGVLLGITPFIGYLLNLPLDIRHVAFSTAYLGYGSMHIDITIGEFLFYLGCVFLIGFVNLTVSFILALKVSLLSRQTSFGNLFSFLKLLILEALKRPHHLFFPMKKVSSE
jgi:site-specific recombinase